MLLTMLQCVSFVTVSSALDLVKEHGLNLPSVFYDHISKDNDLRNKHKPNPLMPGANKKV